MKSLREIMVNYYLISSPLHFFIATNLAIINDKSTNIAIFITKNRKNSNQYCAATKEFSNIFQHTYNLSLVDDKQIVSKRKDCFNKMKHIIESYPPDNIFTGNDRRVEFQYAMHQAKKTNNKLQGIYMDDGAISYLGHKSINKFTHKYIDPLLKKIVYGLWWDSPLTVGSSKWITSAYLAFPEQAHRLLQTKKILPINHNIFKGVKFLAVNEYLTKSYTELVNIDFTRLKVILCLPYESSYLNNTKLINEISDLLSSRYQANEIAIKVHPRSKNISLLEGVFKNCTFIPSSLGMELLLPKLSQNTQIIGDVSTALLTTKWLRPELSVVTFELSQPPTVELQLLFERIGIKKFS